MLVKAGVDASGYRTAVRDYTEPIVLEELAANSYDADASTCLVILDSAKTLLHVVDDGLGFSSEAVELIAVLGGGSKQTIPISKGKRHYLGSYGYGLKSSLNVATKVSISTVSDDGGFRGTVDWTKLDEALKHDFPGFKFDQEPRKKNSPTGTHITLSLKNPTSVDALEQFGDHLANLPNDGASFSCYFGNYADLVKFTPEILDNFGKLQSTAKKLEKRGLIALAHSTRQADLDACQKSVITDKGAKVSATFFFAGINRGKVKQLKTGLRGIYVRIHGRLLKQNFTDSKFTYNISRWKKFESGLRVELSVDWLRDQISLSRTGVRFANSKLEEDFRKSLIKLVSAFISPQLKKLEAKAERTSVRREEQRIELAQKRINRQKSIMVPGLSDGFPYHPETDGELALVLAQSDVLKRLNASYSLLDYNDQAPYDCLLYDKKKRDFIRTELEPTLIEWISHRETDDVELIVTWTLGKWRIGAKKKSKNGLFQLVAGEKEGNYRLLHFASSKSKTPRSDYKVIVMEEILK
jgi:Histidine kinase-, DNA gyrase B-, and HSP90-like ATPase